MQHNKRLLATIMILSLLTSIIAFGKQAAADVSFIEIDISDTDDPFDIPFGMECNDPDFVYVTIFNQGLLAKINKNTRIVEELIENPDHDAILGSDSPTGQGFTGITMDLETGNLFVSELFKGKLYKFEPNTQTFTRIPIIEQVDDPTGGNTIYELGYEVDPTLIQFDLDGDEVDDTGTLFVSALTSVPVFTDGNVWVAIKYEADFPDEVNDNDVDDLFFVGLAKVNPDTLEVTRIPLDNFISGGMDFIAVDNEDPNIIWISETDSDRVHRFDMRPEIQSITNTITLDSGSRPEAIVTDNNRVYVALNEFGDGIIHSKIGQIDKSSFELLEPLDTGAVNDNQGTFFVFINNDILVWTDISFHIGEFDLSSGEPVPIIDETTGLPFINTETLGNRMGCVPVDGEFWFAGEGSAKVGILPNSKFSVGVGVGRARPTGTGGSDPVGRSKEGFVFGDPNAANYDDEAPSIEEVFTSAGSLKVFAKIHDTVGVKDADLIVGKNNYAMERHAGSQNWWVGTIPSTDLTGDTVFFKIVARDYNNNIAEYSGSAEVPPGASSATSQEGASFVVTPLAASGYQPDPNYSIIASDIKPDDANASPQITIKNTGTKPLKNIRLSLSSELKGKFLLSDYAIQSIAPNSNATVTLKLNGKPNVGIMGNALPYKGQVIISVDNHSPIVLELSGEIPNESASLQSLFMKMITSKAEQRYKSIEKPETRISQDTQYQVKLESGENVISSASDELLITNTGDEPLKNLRIMTSSLSDHFIPEQKNIALIPAGSFIKVKLVSKLNNAESPRDLKGELLIVPENAEPVTIPIDIKKRLMPDKNLMYEVRTTSGNDAISSTAEGIIIRNNSEESIDSVRIVLPRELARVLSISEDSFKSIEANSEKIIHIQPRVDGNVKQILNDYNGQIIIVSSDGMKKVFPVNIVWKGISSGHFVIYARNSAEELMKATQVINFLERSYPKVSAIMDEPIKKTVIYMTASLDELRMLTDALAPSTFVYDEDVAFVWSNSEDINMLALREFTYRTIMQSYASYWTKQKIAMDNGNWLVDGVSNYVAARIVGERGMIMEQLDSFKGKQVSFEWYGQATPEQYGATYTLFKFLVQKYGDSIIDKILSYLGSTMISNHRCDTLEQCALLRAVYDANGLNINDKRNDLSFAAIVVEWEQYMRGTVPVKIN